jgi:hypothetical protein
VGKDYVKPGLGTRILATFLRIVPKIGPFKKLEFNSPTPQTEDLYIKSINTTVDQYRVFLEEARTSAPVLPNRDLDDGATTKAGEYTLADDTYAQLLAELSKQKFTQTAAGLRDNLLEFYSDLSAANDTKKDPSRWQDALTALDQLKSVSPAPAVAGNAAQ